MREVDGLKIAFVTSESYFEGFDTPSMGSTAKATGADIVILLAEGKTEADVTDEDVRDVLKAAMSAEEVDLDDL